MSNPAQPDRRRAAALRYVPGESPAPEVVATGEGGPTAIHPRSLVVAGPKARATVVESYLGLGAGRYLTALKAAGYAPRAVLASTDVAFAEALAQERWDVLILVPGVIPVAAAISSAREAHPGLPVVIAEAPAGAEGRLRAFDRARATHEEPRHGRSRRRRRETPHRGFVRDHYRR